MVEPPPEEATASSRPSGAVCSQAVCSRVEREAGLGFIRTGLELPARCAVKPKPSPEPEHAPGPGQGGAVDSPAMVEGRKSTMRVSAMKKLQARASEKAS